ncbi:hypothetical protein [Klenkia taihuensis]|uniref:Uncharacterized protein n=1 Tax=Klenkia taihuensis TaxID=1225127 RepID=A0A1I1IP07_9ACTN|nr:hypothetical protein [Klenkia taihuensis]GHE11328.1 hypothetical protein GCM10011381_24480 [Klenkia taihuensis]SFC38007.1 hypothetical protein SAMN05661030_0825 [Klenkia taihuensis]
MPPVAQWQGWILPVGHPLGEHHDPAGHGPRRLVVRHGSSAEVLTPEDGRIWSRARADSVSGAGAGRVAERIIGLGARPEEAVPRLVDRGLLVHVDPRDADAARVSATVRARPLGSATGGDPDGSMGYGLPGLPPLTRLAGQDVEVWLLAVLAGDLRSAAEGLERVWAEDLGREPDAGVQRAALRTVWDTVVQMTTAGAGYLDTSA